LGLVVPESPDAAAHVVAVEVVAFELGQALAAVDKAARDGLADVVMVFPDGLDEILPRPHAVGPEGVEAFPDVPAVVAALDHQVDLVVEVLAHVPGPQPARLAVEGDAPRIPHPVGPDLRRSTFGAHKGVVPGNAVRLVPGAAIDVDPQDLAQEGLQVLAVL